MRYVCAETSRIRRKVQISMSLFDSLFGGSLSQYTSSNPQQTGLGQLGAANSSSQYTQAQMNSSMAAQQMQAYNNAFRNIPQITKWMIHGEACANVQEFAKKLYPDDPESQMMLILRLGE